MVDQPPDANSSDLKQLGDFRVIRSIGRGGMAHVYLAEQESLKRLVALKVLPPEQLAADDTTLLERFQREAKAGAGLNHPNIVQVYAIGEEQGVHFIAQEYVRGMNLADYLKRNGPPSISVCLRLMRQALAALDQAARAGIVHRDIKPGNLLVTRKSELKIADFGLARWHQPQQNDLQLTQSGTTMGTPLYMSPEQLNGEPLDARSDIYSLGVTFHQLLVGRPPFEGPTAMSVAVQHLRERPPELESLRADVPPALGRIIRRMMSKLPAERFPDARSVLKDLKRITHDETVAELPVMGAGDEATDDTGSLDLAATVQTVREWAQSGWRAAVGRLAAVFVVVAAVGFVLGRLLRPAGF